MTPQTWLTLPIWPVTSCLYLLFFKVLYISECLFCPTSISTTSASHCLYRNNSCTCGRCLPWSLLVVSLFGSFWNIVSSVVFLSLLADYHSWSSSLRSSTCSSAKFSSIYFFSSVLKLTVLLASSLINFFPARPVNFNLINHRRISSFFMNRYPVKW